MSLNKRVNFFIASSLLAHLARSIEPFYMKIMARQCQKGWVPKIEDSKTKQVQQVGDKLNCILTTGEATLRCFPSAVTQKHPKKELAENIEKHLSILGCEEVRPNRSTYKSKKTSNVSGRTFCALSWENLKLQNIFPAFSKKTIADVPKIHFHNASRGTVLSLLDHCEYLYIFSNLEERNLAGLSKMHCMRLKDRSWSKTSLKISLNTFFKKMIGRTSNFS